MTTVFLYFDLNVFPYFLQRFWWDPLISCSELGCLLSGDAASCFLGLLFLAPLSFLLYFMGCKVSFPHSLFIANTIFR